MVGMWFDDSLEVCGEVAALREARGRAVWGLGSDAVVVRTERDAVKKLKEGGPYSRTRTRRIYNLRKIVIASKKF